MDQAPEKMTFTPIDENDKNPEAVRRAAARADGLFAALKDTNAAPELNHPHGLENFNARRARRSNADPRRPPLERIRWKFGDDGVEPRNQRNFSSISWRRSLSRAEEPGHAAVWRS